MKWRGIAAVAGTMAALVGPRSIAAENIHWFSVEDSEQVSLFYGIPQSDYVEIALTCVPGGESVSFSYSSFAMPEAPDGLDTNVILVLDTLDYLIPVTGTRIVLDERLVLAGDVTLEPALQRILRGKGTLTVRVEGGPASKIPLDGLAEAAKPILASCAPK